jgi:lysyl-tRNA synthetase class 2
MPSTVIRRFAYDPAARALDVTFVTGRRYRYAGVPPTEVEAMRAAFSKGRYFNARIRDRYSFVELAPEDSASSSE